MTDRYKTCNILGVDIAVTNMSETVGRIESSIDELRGKYICVSNVHTTVMAHDDASYRRVQQQAAMCIPDGKPLSIYSRKHGFPEAERVTGPDLMGEIFSRDNGLRHFFYGSTEETIKTLGQKLKEQYPDLKIAGMVSPPFRELTPEEDERYISLINASNPDIIWVGLGAPKQERWMNAHLDRLGGLMIGVGAGFDYYAGTIKRAPAWMQKASLEWFYRLMQDPKRLFTRYLKTNFRYIWLTTKQN
jgi:N-acetylglucosaminyldiphosphoundecaprenol N-acetyl-beta-D-mannosaminyltransferase